VESAGRLTKYPNQKAGWFAYVRLCSHMLAYFVGLLGWERSAGYADQKIGRSALVAISRDKSAFPTERDNEWTISSGKLGNGGGHGRTAAVCSEDRRKCKLRKVMQGYLKESLRGSTIRGVALRLGGV